MALMECIATIETTLRRMTVSGSRRKSTNDSRPNRTAPSSSRLMWSSLRSAA